MQTLLVVDDDRALVEALTAALRQYSVVNASDGIAALQQIQSEQPDLVLVDLKLPGMDGAVLLSRIRAVSRVPIIVLSARHEQSDVVSALKYADDFVSKPFDLDNLEARIEAVLRRSPQTSKATEGVYTCGGLAMSGTGLSTMNGDLFELTLTEHKVLLILTEHADELVMRGHLYETLWGGPTGGLARSPVDVHVTRIRRRLARCSNAPTIATVRGRGFMLQRPGVESGEPKGV